jgi:hypothetical protein
MQKGNYKIWKYANMALLAIAAILIAYSILRGYLYLNSMTQNLNGTPAVYVAAYSAVLLIPILELIFLVICAFFMFKNKSWAYFWTGIVAASVLSDGINSIIKANIKINFIMTLTILFWIVLIVLSFYMYSQTRKLKK